MAKAKESNAIVSFTCWRTILRHSGCADDVSPTFQHPREGIGELAAWPVHIATPTLSLLHKTITNSPQTHKHTKHHETTNHTMSSNFSSSSTSYSYSSSTGNGAPQISGQRSSSYTTTDSAGNTVVHSATQNLGDEPVVQTRQYDSQGRELTGGDESAQGRIGDGNTSGNGQSGRVVDVTDAEDGQQAEKDRLYEERIEEEYAKREGGA